MQNEFRTAFIKFLHLALTPENKMSNTIFYKGRKLYVENESPYTDGFVITITKNENIIKAIWNIGKSEPEIVRGTIDEFIEESKVWC